MASPPPIIIKRIKKASHAHHGGAWKVAYADFVTAMMAFFLLLWLLNVTTDVERKGIADYFAPASISKSESGAGGMFGGQTISAPGAQVSDSSPIGVGKSVPEDEASAPGKGDAAVVRATLEKATPAPAQQDDAEKKQEEASFKNAENALRETLRQAPGMAGLEKNIIIDSTPEGLRIQIVDRDGYSLFAPGNAALSEKSRTLIGLVGKVLARLPNAISVTGHTDNSPFPAASRRNNWELSSARAETSMETLVQNGVAAERVTAVIGKAERDPLVKEDPKNPQNRRISIVLLRQFRKGSGQGTEDRGQSTEDSRQKSGG